MPLIQVTAPQGALSKNDQERLMSQLSNAVLKAEGASIDDPDAQSLVWTYYVEQEKSAIYIGGTNLDDPPFASPLQRHKAHSVQRHDRFLSKMLVGL